MKTKQPVPGPVVYHGSKLDMEYDGLTLRQLLVCRQLADQEGLRSTFTPAQREAVSAHWSAELRARMAAKAPSVVMPDHELETANCADAKDGDQ